MIPSTPAKERHGIEVNWFTFIIGIAALATLSATQLSNYLLFHSLVSFFGIAVAIGIFIVAWNCRDLAKDAFLLFLGMGYLGLAVMDVLHVLAHKGMGVFPEPSEDLSTQLWISARYVAGSTLLLAPFFLRSPPRPRLYLSITIGFILALLSTLFIRPVFPTCLIDGQATLFKKMSEVVICMLSAGAIITYSRNRAYLDPRVFSLLVAAIIFALAADICFTTSAHFSDSINHAGHLLKIISYYLVYKALIETGLRKPHTMLFRQIILAEKNTEKEKAFLKKVIDSVPGFICVKHLDGRFILVNKTLAEAYGVTSEDLTGKSHADFIRNPRETEQFLRDDREVIEQMREKIIPELKMTFANGQEHWLATIKIPLKEDDGGCSQLLAVGMDITDRKRAEEELAKYQSHLEELVELRTQELMESREVARRNERLASIGTFAAGIAHEIRNPLGGIMLAAENLYQFHGRPDADKIIEDCLHDIAAHTNRCKDIIDNVLQFARDTQSEKTPSDINLCVQRAVTLTNHYVSQRGGTVDLHLSTELPQINMNALSIEQVLVNLIQNAVESSSTNIRVAIQTEKIPHGVRITIRDNGAGIAGNHIKHIFDPFFTTRMERGGSGLGLSLVHGIIAEHRGTIDVQSQLGSGTTFTIDLPAEPDNVSPPGTSVQEMGFGQNTDRG